jgi:transcriptional regulator with XRE-family HTH domain
MAEDQTEYTRAVGERLRSVRKARGLTLQEVEATSADEFKASVVGAYERGERAISIRRLQRLATFYRVPIDHFLPRQETDEVIELDRSPAEDARIIVDLRQLERLQDPQRDLLLHYLTNIQDVRSEQPSPLMIIRREDLRTIAALLGTVTYVAERRLVELSLGASRT